MLNRPNLDDNNLPQDVEDVLLSHFPSQPFAVVPPTDDTVGGDSGDGGNDACKLVMTHLAAYQDNELDPDQCRVIEAHLGKCPECAAGLEALQTTDMLIEREWRESAPLPSSLRLKQSVDSIMTALPPAPVAPTAFAPKRVHSRGRWMRFSAGMASLIAFVSLLWSSYRLGYEHGRMSLNPSTSPAPARTPRPHFSSSPRLIPILFAPPAPHPDRPPEHTLSLSQLRPPMQTFARSLR
jgi:hypothetical protein